MILYKRAVVGFLAVLLLTEAASVRGQSTESNKPVVAVFKLKGALPESPLMFDIGGLFGGKSPLTMFDLLERLRTARTDDNVQAVILEIEEAALGFAQIQELRTQIEALKAAEKDVWVYCETLWPGTLLLGSAASKLVMMPTGELAFHGIYGEQLYFLNLMNKIGCEADIIHCGAFKSAGEPLYRDGPSKESEEQTNRLVDSMFEQMIGEVAKSRKLDVKRVRELIDRANFSAAEAKEAKLVDRLAYREEFVKSIKKSYSGAKIVSDYGRKKGPELDFDDPFAVFKLFSNLMKPKKEPSKPAVAVVYVEGMIVGGEAEPSLFGGTEAAHSETIRKAIAEAAKDKTIKALVLRVDSPGGSAIASDVICEATKRFKASGRPFIVSMGNVAGSGGYYVSTLGDVIFAEPATITGSIGVVGGKIVTKGLWDWVGVSTYEIKRGKHADILNTNRRFTDEERAMVTTMMTRVYDEFKARVIEGRRDRIKGELEPLAGGRVYTGKQALEIGLVDKLGGFADAIKHAASEAELGSDYELRVFPKPKSVMDLFSEAFGGKSEKDEFIGTRRMGLSRQTILAIPGLGGMLEAVRRIDPARARCVENLLIQLELFSKESVLLIGPGTNLVLP